MVDGGTDGDGCGWGGGCECGCGVVDGRMVGDVDENKDEGRTSSR